MKIVLIVVGSLGALYALIGIAQFFSALSSSDSGTAYGGANIAASIVPVCVGAIVSAVCFHRAFRNT